MAAIDKTIKKIAMHVHVRASESCLRFFRLSVADRGFVLHETSV
jgi:hypothetical protein